MVGGATEKPLEPKQVRMARLRCPGLLVTYWYGEGYFDYLAAFLPHAMITMPLWWWWWWLLI